MTPSSGTRGGGRPIPFTVIGGFLGAGKTTAINALLAAVTDRRIAVLVNDFGGLAIDAALVANRNATTIGLTNGCVCCSLAGGLVKALLDVLALAPPPDCIVVEASGVSDPRRIAQIARADAALAPDATIVLVAADQWPSLSIDRHVGDVVRAQVTSADILVLNKVDLVGPEDVAACRAALRALAPRASILEARDAQLPYLDLLGHGLDRALADPAIAVADDRHARQFTTRVLRSAGPLPAPRLREALQNLPPSVLRAKGFVRLDHAPGDWQLVQVVAARWSLVPARVLPTNGVSTLVVMGATDALDDASLSQLAAVFAPPPGDASETRARQSAPAAHGR